MDKKTVRFYRSFFLHKTNKNMQKKQGWNAFYIRMYDATYAESKTLQFHNFVKSDQNVRKLCTRFFLHKINKNMA